MEFYELVLKHLENNKNEIVFSDSCYKEIYLPVKNGLSYRILFEKHEFDDEEYYVIVGSPCILRIRYKLSKEVYIKLYSQFLNLKEYILEKEKQELFESLTNTDNLNRIL